MTWNVWRARTHPEEVKAESLHRIAECLETLIELEKRQADSLDRIGMLMLLKFKGDETLYRAISEQEIDTMIVVRAEAAKQNEEYLGASKTY